MAERREQRQRRRGERRRLWRTLGDCHVLVRLQASSTPRQQRQHKRGEAPHRATPPPITTRAANAALECKDDRGMGQLGQGPPPQTHTSAFACSAPLRRAAAVDQATPPPPTPALSASLQLPTPPASSSTLTPAQQGARLPGGGDDRGRRRCRDHALQAPRAPPPSLQHPLQERGGGTRQPHGRLDFQCVPMTFTHADAAHLLHRRLHGLLVPVAGGLHPGHVGPGRHAVQLLEE